MLPRPLRRRFRPMWIAALASAAWANRQDLRRWINFAKDALNEREQRPMAEILTEAKVRAAVSMDPVLRRDPELRDLAVRNGVVTLFTTEPGGRDRFARLARVKGITRVEPAVVPSALRDPIREPSLSATTP